jgi:PKD repeat protein
VALASSASGSFKLDDVSIIKTGGTFSKPEITDSVDPVTLVKPVITVNNTKPVQFEQNSTDDVDLKTYFTVTDNKDSITITDQMINNGGFDLTKVGQYTVTLTVKDSDGNESIEHVILSVYPEVVEQQSNTALVASLTSVVALGVGFGVAFVVFKKVKKI